MDIKLMKLLSENQPQLNKRICNGLGYAQSRNRAYEKYIHEILLCAAMSFPEGLTYDGTKQCSPYVQFRETVRRPKPRHMFGLEKNNTYMMEYHFSFNGIRIRSRYVMLPYIERGGLLTLNGTKYRIQSVLGGSVFNIENGVVFMTTPRTPMMFRKEPIGFMLNGMEGHGSMVYTRLYNMKEVERSNIHSSLLHYILAQHGLTKTLKIYFKVDVIVGYSELESKYEEGTHYVYWSRNIPPSGQKLMEDNPFRFAIPKEQWTIDLNNVVGTIIYIIDHSKGSILLDDIDNPDLWLQVLPLFLFKSQNSALKSFELVERHMDTVRKSMDTLTQFNLESIKIKCNDIYDLFLYMINNFHEMVMYEDVGSMYNQELSTVRHICHSIVCNIFKVMFNLKKLTGDRITAKKITHEMDILFRMNRINTVSGHGELSSKAIATDSIFFGNALEIISQHKAAITAAGSSTKHVNAGSDPTLLLHASQLEVSMPLFTTKSDPTGRSRINPWVKLGERDNIMADPDLKEAIARVDAMIRRY